MAGVAKPSGDAGEEGSADVMPLSSTPCSRDSLGPSLSGAFRSGTSTSGSALNAADMMLLVTPQHGSVRSGSALMHCPAPLVWAHSRQLTSILNGLICHGQRIRSAEPEDVQYEIRGMQKQCRTLWPTERSCDLGVRVFPLGRPRFRVYKPVQ